MATLRIDSRELEQMRRLVESADKRLGPAVASAVNRSLNQMVRSVVQKISGPYLGVRTGTARRSITASPAVYDGQQVVGSLGSPLRYVRAHELGFNGAVGVRAHTRRRGGAEQVLFTRWSVRAHVRQVNMRARRFFRDTLAEQRADLDRNIVRALLSLVRTGNVPTLSEIGGV